MPGASASRGPNPRERRSKVFPRAQARRVPSRRPRNGADVKVLYFAWVRQKIGRSEEEFEAPSSVTDVTGLIDYLRARGPQYEAAFRDSKALRCAVNQENTAITTKIVTGDAIAFY